MPNLKIDFSKIKEEVEEEKSFPLEEKEGLSKPTTKKRRVITCLVIFLIAFFLIWGAKSLLSQDNELSPQPSLWTQITHLITSRDKALQGEDTGRINFLLLGMGGAGHDGPYLSDTIILASLDVKNKKVALLSIPRDLVMPIPGYGWRKINNANAYGEMEKPGFGSDLAVKTISSVLQIPIHYYLRVDFSGFTEFINETGDLKICVDKSFTDNEYPTDDHKIQTISFSTGCQMMNGETALKFVRSRHGNNGEGSDFARSKRQQKVILALKEKLLSIPTLANPLNIKRIYDQYNDHVATNMEIWEMLRLAKLAHGINQENIITYGLDDGPGGYLEVLIGEDGAFLLQPPGGDFSRIRQLVANIFQADTEKPAEQKETTVTTEEKPVEKVPVKKLESSKIEIRNGTFITGLASKAQTYLQNAGYNVPTVGNTPFRDYEKNVVYDLSGGKFPETIKFLTENLKANVSDTIPNWIKNISTNDIVLILGKEAGGLDF